MPNPVSASVPLEPCAPEHPVAHAAGAVVPTVVSDDPLPEIWKPPVAYSPPVAMVNVLPPSTAIMSTAMEKLACVALVTVTGPALTPSPSAAIVVPCTK